MTIVPRPLAPPLHKINPPQWPPPRGPSYAVVGTGTFVFLGSQIATDNAGRVTTIGLVPQARQALQNLRIVLAEAGGTPEHIAQMTWYMLDIDHYRMLLAELGVVYRRPWAATVPQWC